ncbi:transposase, partial [Hahella sp. CCB-MM4]|uniref:transposase n=1 Tax=Hahella sp. (strain CCB-MM4) TaxID=1926491 RepID=UPI001FEE4FC6
MNLTCRCPAGQEISFRGTRTDEYGNPKAHFEGRLLQCRHCDLKHECMRNPTAADHRKGTGRQVSFIIEHRRRPNYTDWMKHRVDSPKG